MKVPGSQPVAMAQNVFWFWFDKALRRQLHGTVQDAARKLALFRSKGFGLEGLEIFIMPSRLEDAADWPASFTRDYASLGYRTVHIGDGREDFLHEPETAGHLRRLHHFLEVHGVGRIIVHANHLDHNRPHLRELFEDTLPGIEICIENTGFNNRKGWEPAFLEQLCRDFPAATVCLDIAHVADFREISLAGFIENPVIQPRIHEIHFSYSTHLLDEDPYVACGYPGYGPLHALFSALGEPLSPPTWRFIANYPVVIEGVLPMEDENLDLLRAEVNIVKTGAREQDHTHAKCG